MAGRRPALLLVVALGLLAAGALAALTFDDTTLETTAGGDRSTTTTTRAASTTSTTAAAPPTTVLPAPAPVPWPPIPADRVRAVATPGGVVLPVLGAEGAGFRVATPCGSESVVGGTPIAGAHVVLDAGHGGDEPGAVGPAGLVEKDVNLAVVHETARRLEASGATVVLTRTADYRITLATRAAIAVALEPVAFISVHHNAEPDGPFAGPGAETYYQIESPDSRRLAGLLVEELRRAFAEYDIDWHGDTDAGAKYRLTSDGGNYYGILSRSEGVAAVLSEAAFISNPAEEGLLADPTFRALEAEAITRAVVRFVSTDDPGSGYVDPYPRETPAGSGGGASGCVDPPLG